MRANYVSTILKQVFSDTKVKRSKISLHFARISTGYVHISTCLRTVLLAAKIFSCLIGLFTATEILNNRV